LRDSEDYFSILAFFNNAYSQLVIPSAFLILAILQQWPFFNNLDIFQQFILIPAGLF